MGIAIPRGLVEDGHMFLVRVMAGVTVGNRLRHLETARQEIPEYAVGSWSVFTRKMQGVCDLLREPSAIARYRLRSVTLRSQDGGSNPVLMCW